MEGGLEGGLEWGDGGCRGCVFGARLGGQGGVCSRVWAPGGKDGGAIVGTVDDCPCLQFASALQVKLAAT